MSTWMPWLLSATGVLGMYLSGRKFASGWAVAFGSEVLWLWYALKTGQYGFIAGVAAYGAVFGWNYLTWTKATKEIEKYA